MEILDRIDSTSVELKRRLHDGPLPHGFALVAREQTAGHGRLGRAWQSAPGAGLLCSVWLRLEQPPAQAAGFSLVPPLAVLDILDPLLAQSGISAGCKWPNDIRIKTPQGFRKVSGILTECCPITAHTVVGVIVGVGLNLRQAPVGDDPPAISLSEVVPILPALETLATALQAALLRRTAQWLSEGRESLFALWQARCDHRGGLVRVTLNGIKTEGCSHGIGTMGQLLLEVDGKIREVWAEDIST